MTSGDAARLLEVSTETIRRWVDNELLDGFSEVREYRRRYFVSREAVRQRLRNRVSDPGDLQRQVDQLRDQVEELQATGHIRGSEDLARERDAFRAENAALKEGMLRLNGAMEHMQRAAEEQAAALQEQREALSVLLTPHSPAASVSR